MATRIEETALVLTSDKIIRVQSTDLARLIGVRRSNGRL